MEASMADTTTTTPNNNRLKCKTCIKKSFLLCPLLISIILFIITILYFQRELLTVSTQLKVEMKSTIQSQLKSQDADIESLRQIINNQVLQTQQLLNTTMTEVEQSINDETQTLDEDVKTENSLVGIQFAGTFTLLGVIVSMFHMFIHVRSFHDALIQRRILVVLLVCPVLSFASWLSLVFVDQDDNNVDGYISIVTACYEAFCVFSFLSFLGAVLVRGKEEEEEGEDDGMEQQSSSSSLPDHAADQSKPILRYCCFFSSSSSSKINNLPYQIFVLQYVVIRPLVSIAMTISNHFYHHQGNVLTLSTPQFYLILIINASVLIAFVGLIFIYNDIKIQKKGSWCRPFPKFVCFVGIIFVTFWQKSLIYILATTLWNDELEDATIWSFKAQHFLICLEMLFFAVAHCFVYPPEEWEVGYNRAPSSAAAATPQHKHNNHADDRHRFGDQIALRDFIKDVKLVMKSRRYRSKKLKGRDSGSIIPSEDLFDDDYDRVVDPNHDLRLSALEDVVAISNVQKGHRDGAIDNLRWNRMERYIHESDHHNNTNYNSTTPPPPEIT